MLKQGLGKNDSKMGKGIHVSKAGFCRFCRLLYERHLVTGVGGNVSARVRDGILITPSGISLRDMKPEQLVKVNEKGEVLAGSGPTKDMEIHLGIFGTRPEINVVCHVHGAFIVAASTLMEPGPDTLPPLTPGLAYFAHPIPMIPFMVPGAKELAKATTAQFSRSSCRALLLQNHGLLSVGVSFEEAVNVAEEIDEVARIYLLTNGQGLALSAEDVDRIKKLSSGP